MSRISNIHSWLEERLGWDELVAPLMKKSVPMHRLSYWYFLEVSLFSSSSFRY